jgi:predicted DNA-binding transcriptional regulator YafY
MSKRESISRYNLIIKKVRKYPATFDEITDYLDRESELQEYDFRISKRTFQRDLNDIRSLYDIDIIFDRSRKVYFIDSEDKSQAAERILEAFDTFNALNVADRLSDFIHFENRRAKGTENLYGLLHAIQNRLQITFSYLKFWEDQPSTRQAETYALKEFKNRWYLLSNDLVSKKLRIFALDRLTGLEISKRTFPFPTDFNVKVYFRYCFGIIQPDNQVPEQVILSFDPDQGKFIKSLPLHDSQQILIDNAEEFRIKLELYNTFDFIMEILSYGSRVKVLEPAGLAEEVKMALLNAYQQYSEGPNT